MLHREGTTRAFHGQCQGARHAINSYPPAQHISVIWSTGTIREKETGSYPEELVVIQLRNS